MDFSEGMLDIARQKVQAPHVHFVQQDIRESWKAEDGQADLITCNLVLEHVEQLDQVFAEAARCLKSGGHLFISEYHPFRQYLGKQARFEAEGKTVKLEAYMHHVSDFLNNANKAGLRLAKMDEWFDIGTKGQAPRLISILFKK